MLPSIPALLNRKGARDDDILYGTALGMSLIVLVVTTYFLRVVKGILQWLAAGRLLRKQFPSPPVDSRILGHAPSMAGPRHHRWLQRMAEQCGKTFYMRLAHNHVAVILDPTLTPPIFDRMNYPPNTDTLDRPVDEMLHKMDAVFSDSGSPTLLTDKTGSEMWRLVRKGIAPAFNPQNIRQGFKHVVIAADQLIKGLKARGPAREVDIDNMAQRVTMEVIGQVGFGKGFGSLDDIDRDNKVFRLVASGLEESTVRFVNPVRHLMFWDQDVRRAKADLREFHAITKGLWNEVKARGPPAEDDMTIAAHLMRLRDGAGQPLSDARMHAEVSIMFIAGMDTSGHTIANTLCLISEHPEVEAKVAAELDALGLLVTPQRPQPAQLEYSDLSKLTYLTAAVKESMRMMAVVGAGVARVAKKDLQLGPYTIPKNAIVWVPTQAMHSSADLWDRPDKYMPERWLEKDAEYWAPASTLGTNGKAGGAGQQQQQYKRYLPFGDGPRICIGMSLAKMNYMAVTALLLSHFKFRLTEQMGGLEGRLAAEQSRITVSPHDGMWMHAIPRG